MRDDLFRDALGGAHDAARVDGFVGGDHQELTGAIFEGGGGENGGAENVVGDDRDGILLHERDVFEGGHEGIKTLLAATKSPASVSPQDRMIDLLAGTSEDDKSDAHTQLVEDMIRIFEAQRLI